MALMQFDEFATRLDAAIRAAAAVDAAGGDRRATAEWSARTRRAAVALVPPLNVSVTLDGAGDRASTTWYPIDAALVPVVSNRIAAFLSEA